MNIPLESVDIVDFQTDDDSKLQPIFDRFKKLINHDVNPVSIRQYGYKYDMSAVADTEEFENPYIAITDQLDQIRSKLKKMVDREILFGSGEDDFRNDLFIGISKISNDVYILSNKYKNIPIKR